MGIGDNKSVWRDVESQQDADFTLLNHKLKVYSFNHINRYIKRKKEWISNIS